jgi:tRNA(Arg) A34 adenosine deaminase TadA
VSLTVSNDAADASAAPAYPPQGLTPTPAQIVRHLRHSSRVAERATLLGHHPFGAVLVGPDQETVLMEQGNVDTVLARVAARNFTPEYLWSCTLYTSVEPCCMCAGTMYWANIGRVVFGMTEKRLLEATGDHSENPTMSVDCRYVFDHCQKTVEVIGPVAEVESEVMEVQRRFWTSR